MIKTATWKGRRWERQDDGTWIDLATGQVDPLAEDMTISNFYNLRMITYGIGRSFVEVPLSLALNEPDLEWALKFRGTLPQEEGEEWRGAKPKTLKDYQGKPVILVPAEVWDRKNDEIGAVGMWHPDIK